eukprot:m.89545 g.89545  ORF g.89545 m.89545 type:complete len:614 (+) comp21526_c0_seq1:406-2247(+)
MPTGGGKSLCFQLPALIGTGVTLVISPLLSLMQDQLLQLRELKIPALQLTSNTSRENFKEAMIGLEEGAYKLLYVTPEKVVKSKSLLNKLTKLNTSGLLQRIVVDEAHCCSCWGHDYRPDYGALSVLKRQFPTIPLMALTATATKRVQAEVTEILNIEGCEVFRASSERPNLHFDVRYKPADPKALLDAIALEIKTKFTGQSGIIYCLSRKEVEALAKSLSAAGIKARPFHAWMPADLRESVHHSWTTNRIQVVVATVAFGLGINKPDVRFVIHQTMAKSLDSYYQECGRAGRDGKVATCILYYRSPDLIKLSTMVCTEQGGVENLFKMCTFAENQTQCRRVALARHFGEQLTAVECKKTCDVCQSNANNSMKQIDVTEEAELVLDIVAHLEGSGENKTFRNIVDLWRGSGRKGLKMENLAKAPKWLDKETCERIVAQLLIEKVLKQRFSHTPYNTNSYIRVGSFAAFLRDRSLRIQCSVLRDNPTTQASKRSKGGQPKKKRRLQSFSGEENMTAECTSSPTTNLKQKRTNPKQSMASDDDQEDEDDLFLLNPRLPLSRGAMKINQTSDPNSHVHNEDEETTRMVNAVLDDEEDEDEPGSDNNVDSDEVICID